MHQLRPIHRPKRRKRVGRGGKRGNYCGRGIKGQNVRAGAKFQPIVRELIKRYPKLRGYKFKPKAKNQRIEVVNLPAIEKGFNEKETVSPASLLERKIVDKIKGRIPEVKILGRGEIKKSLTIEGCEVSKGAKEKIEKAGGIIRMTN